MGRRRLILAILALAAILYGGIAGFLYLNQERILFPAALVAPAGRLPPGAERLTIETPDGTRLEGVHLPAAAADRTGNLLLVFAGNATNAQGLAELVHQMHPDHDVAAFFYRGYSPSGGVAGAQALADDTPLVHDLVADRFRPRRIVAVGVSLGSGVAAGLAARRPIAGAILITPFDSLSATAGQLYPWLPVSLLLRHDLRSADQLRDSPVPVAIIAAGQDRLVPPQRTEALRRSVARLVFDATLPEAGHNDVLLHPGFAPAMREALARIEEEAAR